MNAESPLPKKHKAGWLNLAVDYGPVVAFFLAYRHFSPADSDNAVATVLAAVKATVVFMVAAVAALVISRWKLGRISPMLWLSTGLILGFGVLTIWLGDPDYIQMKPTAIYLLFGTTLLIGVLRGKAMLKYVLEAAFDGLNDEGWMKLSRNWAVFFFVLAALNEVLRHHYNKSNGGFDTWIALKLWLFMPLSFLFTFVQIPMLLRHGMAEDAESDVVDNLPPE
jgi:intracellular septation protein